MNKYKAALQSIMDSYDAFYIENKYGECITHKKEFELLESLATPDNKVKNALAWIKDKYDCFYKEEYMKIKDNPFTYLDLLIDKEK